jgi:hypothetical protein
MSDIRYRKTNITHGGENMYHCHEEENMCCTHHPRMFLTKEEKIKKLNEYKEWLDNESKGIAETIAKLKES